MKRSISRKTQGKKKKRGAVTNIHAKKYREFVDKNPSKVTYFQPILDKLDYAPSKLELGIDAVFVEGKNDFYTLSYFKEVEFKDKYRFKIIPSSGANDLGPLISLYLGWGKPFVAVLDDDKAGRNAVERYREEWHLSNEVQTIAFALPQLSGKAIEKILSEDAIELIGKSLEKNSLTKKDIGRFFQERFAQNKKIEMDAKTISNVRQLLDACKKKLR